MLRSLQALLVLPSVELPRCWWSIMCWRPSLVAMARLVPHQGRLIALELQQWPALLPAPPTLKFRVTPAGLLGMVRPRRCAGPRSLGAN